MTRATRVYSTPPTNTSAIDHPMMFPPRDPTRRRFLAVAAAGAVAAAIPTYARANPGHAVDPAFALIAEKLAADVAHCEAIDAQDEADTCHGFRSEAAAEAADNCAAAGHAVNEVDWKLANTLPTTLAGVAAVLRFANEIEDGGMEWPNTDTIGREGWHYQLRATMAAAIEALINAQDGKAVRS
jgi:hypothetical protein